MSRELRRRTSRPNYAAILSYGEEEDADNAQPQAVVADPDSESDFAPEKELNVANEENDGEVSPLSDISDEDQVIIDSDNPSASEKGVSIGLKKKKKAVTPMPGKSRRHTNPILPSVHHRHRAIPLYQKKGIVERLFKRPRLFNVSEFVSTNSWGSSGTVLSRVAKAWGYNIGPGPLWELLEDRGWYSESVEYTHAAEESKRRPRVYSHLRIQPCWEVIFPTNAEQFIHQGMSASSSSSTQRTVKCSFGPFKSQQQMELCCFDSIAMEYQFPHSMSHVFNAGGPVWGLDWCPLHSDDERQKQYLAVAPLPSHDYTPQVGIKVPRPNLACIQLWSLNPPDESHYTGGPHSYGSNSGSMKCELVMCINTGPAHEIKWCPLPSNDPIQGSTGPAASVRRLGLLAGAFEDGTVSIFVVPYPADVTSGMVDTNHDEPTYIKVLEPLVRLELEDTACWCVDWANSEVIAVGCSNGNIAVFDVAEAIRNRGSDDPVLPTYYTAAHQSAIRSISWVRTPSLTPAGQTSSDDPHVIVSVSYDGLVAATDLRAACGNTIYRTRDVVNTACYSPYAGGPISIDQGAVKVVSLSPVMLNKGHTVTEPDGPVWSLSASDYHPQLAIGVADGTCQTTNTLRNTRRGGSVPFLSHIIYQLDYNRKTGEYRMLEHFLPKENEKGAAGAKTKVPPKAAGAWPPQVGVTRVVWNSGNGLSNASLLASATASGLCRVDWLTGRWSKTRIPYNGIEGIRAEIEADEEMDEDSD